MKSKTYNGEVPSNAKDFETLQLGAFARFNCGIRVQQTGRTVVERFDRPRSSLLLLALLLALSCVGCATRANTGGAENLGSARHVFLVRHTEREWEGEDPPLTAAGEARAQALAATLRDAGVTAIITTQWQRTRDIARPLAKLLQITPEVIPVYEGKSLENIREVAAAVRRHKDETVLVVCRIPSHKPSKKLDIAAPRSSLRKYATALYPQRLPSTRYTSFMFLLSITRRTLSHSPQDARRLSLNDEHGAKLHLARRQTRRPSFTTADEIHHSRFSGSIA
jgi:phosphohistidine phosphatase SixA